MGKLLSKSEGHNENYLAKVVVVDNLRKHPNADSLQMFRVDGKEIITDMTTKEGDVRILFVTESALNLEYLAANNDFIPSLNMNKDPLHNEDTNPNIKEKKEKRGGFFGAKGRVKALRLRQIPSQGYMVPVKTLAFMLSAKEQAELETNVGEEFDTVKDFLLVKKYVVKESRQQGAGGSGQGKKPKETKLIEGQVHLHTDTAQLGKNIFKVEPNSFIVLSDKWHGCVADDTIIETLEFGKLTIKEIYDQRLVCHIKAFDFDANEIVFVPIDQYYFLPDDGEWYEIELEDGRTIQITGNNPVWLPELNCYRKVEDLSTDDLLSVETERYSEFKNEDIHFKLES